MTSQVLHPTTNALGHAETYQYNPRFGTPVALTGPNNLTTTWAYDAFGRKVLETRADGTQSRWDYAWCGAACPNGGYGVTRRDDGSAPVSVIRDALDRELRTETDGFDSRTILKDTVYDDRGRVIRGSAGPMPRWGSMPGTGRGAGS